MGVYTGTIPTFLAGELPSATKFTEISNFGLAATTAWTTWTPTLTNLVAGSTPVVAKYRQLGKTIDWRFRWVFSAGASVGTDPKFSLPVTPHSEYPVSGEFLFPGKMWILDTGTRFQQGDLRHDALGVLTLVVWSAINTVAGITSTSPQTWATGDTMNAYGSYEAA